MNLTKSLEEDENVLKRGLLFNVNYDVDHSDRKSGPSLPHARSKGRVEEIIYHLLERRKVHHSAAKSGGSVPRYLREHEIEAPGHYFSLDLITGFPAGGRGLMTQYGHDCMGCNCYFAVLAACQVRCTRVEAS